jgi:CheY-like chemotaxis protein
LPEKLYCDGQSSGHNGKTVMLHKRRKILVVDDEHAIAATLARILEMRGYETAQAYSGEEAVQVACSFQPDCIVSDVMMGEMNGIDAAIEILRTLPYCKVLFISGNAGYGDLLENARAKGFDFEILLKPVPPPELLARIAQILSHSAAQIKT